MQFLYLLPLLAATLAESSSSEEVIYVDVTSTPTVTASTGVEATVTMQSTLLSTYSSSNDSAVTPMPFEGGAGRPVMGAAGLAFAAYLL